MIDGITVLNVESITRLPVWFWIILSAIVILTFALCAGELYIIGFLLGMMLTVILCTITKPVPTGRYQYEVTIDETVSISEVYDNYEVIEQRGDIWVLEDKEK